MSFGVWELVLVLAVVVLMFGTGKLTRAMGDLAKGVRNFRDEMKDVPADQAQRSGSATEPAPRALPSPAAMREETRERARQP